MSLILVSGVVAVAEHRKTAIALAVLSVVAILLAWTEWIVPAGRLPALRVWCALGAFLVLAFAVGINVFASGHAMGDRVFGAVAGHSGGARRPALSGGHHCPARVAAKQFPLTVATRAETITSQAGNT